MKTYKYVARDAEGQRHEGLKRAPSTGEVVGWLREQGLVPVSVDQVVTSVGKKRVTARRKRIKSSDLAALCWQLTTMLEGGISVPAALETIAADTENMRLQAVLKEIGTRMQRGEPFSDCLAKYPSVFNRLSVAMVLAGETGGNLATALRRLAEYFDSRDKLAKKVKAAMAYPTFIFVFIILIVIFIMAFIVPRFKTIFDQIGGQLPAFTRAFFGFYNVLQANIIYIIGLLLLLIVSVVLLAKTRRGHYTLCKMVLSVPLLGKVFSQAFIVTFCNTMATLLSAGVSVLEVFDILSTMTNNDVIRDSISRTRERIVEGSNISLGLAASGFFPNVVVKMVEVGEESGSLSTVLERTADYYERKVDSTITAVMSMLEPMMIVIVGAIVLVVVLALYLPIFSMSDIRS